MSTEAAFGMQMCWLHRRTTVLVEGRQCNACKVLDCEAQIGNIYVALFANISLTGNHRFAVHAW